ncbi:class I SAM-dependent methyltransferase [uncultured Tenacibaculum sp.]|uniref:class I SAM-dependent methyltransferase n=1 Tax=uncultured Tenacibaculum sp. TaxID=174713 RepID=UPI00263767DD|nr:class I SAM-dependent methyltransferase [uncultured Tenacibaculum sp.]
MAVDKYQNIIQTYNKVSQQYYDKFMNTTVYHHSYGKLLKHTQKAHETVLDVASGPGNITKYLLNKRSDFKILGVDAAENMIQLAKENNTDANFTVLDCRNIKKLEQKFDIVIFGFCFPYISKEDCIQLIEDAYKVLNKNGLLYISTMIGNYNTDSGYKTSSDGKNSMFIHYHNPEYLIETIHNNKFQLLENYTKEYQEGTTIGDTDLFLIAKK